MTVALPKKFAKVNTGSIRVVLPKKQETEVCNPHCLTAPREQDWEKAKLAFGFREEHRAAFMAGALWMLKTRQE